MSKSTITLIENACEEVFKENGIDTDITPPTIIKGDSIFINTGSYGSTAIIRISGNFGEIGLFVGLTN